MNLTTFLVGACAVVPPAALWYHLPTLITALENVMNALRKILKFPMFCHGFA